MSVENQMPEEETVVETHEEWSLRKRRERMRVSRFQAKAALLQADLLEVIEQAVLASGDPLVSLAWQEASFDRLSHFIAEMQDVVGMTDEQLDSLFESAMIIR